MILLSNIMMELLYVLTMSHQFICLLAIGIGFYSFSLVRAVLFSYWLGPQPRATLTLGTWVMGNFGAGSLSKSNSLNLSSVQTDCLIDLHYAMYRDDCAICAEITCLRPSPMSVMVHMVLSVTFIVGMCLSAQYKRSPIRTVMMPA